MSNTIYVVTSGSFSEYSINALFDSKDKAEAFIAYEAKYSRRPSELDIEEWELNRYYDPIQRGLTCFTVWFDDIYQGDGEIKASAAMRDGFAIARDDTAYNGKIYYQTTVWAQDETAALKIANERRVRYIIEHTDKERP